MSSKPETKLRNAVERLLPKEVHREKMSNPYRAGGADSWYDGPTGDIWIEWKWLPALPKRPTTMVKPDLSLLQKLWLSGRHQNGRKVFVVVGSPDGCIIFATPGDWEAGVARADAQVLPKPVIAEWITNHVASSDRAGGAGVEGRVHGSVLRDTDVARPQEAVER